MAILLRPVTVRAMRTQPITASEPVLQKRRAVEAGEFAEQLGDLAGHSGCCGPMS